MSAMARRRSLLVGTALLVVFGLALYLGFTAQRGLPWAQRTMVSAAFADMGGLRVGDDVRIARVRVGQVESVGIVDGRAIARLAIDGARDVHADATASIESRSGLGQKFVDIRPGTDAAGPLPDGTVLDERANRSAQNLSDLLAVFDDPTRTALTSTLRQTGQGVGGHGQDVQDVVHAAPRMLPDLGTVSRALTSDGGAGLSDMLTAADRLSGRFQGREQDLAALTGDLDSTLAGLGTDRTGPVKAALDRAPGTLDAARGALADLRPPLRDVDASMTDLEPGGRALGDATPDLRGVLREAVPPLTTLPDVAERAVPAVESLTGTMNDARPFAPRATEALEHTDPFVSTLSPYAPEMMLFFENLAATMQDGQGGTGDPGNRHLRVMLIPHTESVTGQAGIHDPFVARNPYPAPGEAGQDSTGSAPLPNLGGHR